MMAKQLSYTFQTNLFITQNTLIMMEENQYVNNNRKRELHSIKMDLGGLTEKNDFLKYLQI